jgi:tetratricopeptide (TPR) repeat protein
LPHLCAGLLVCFWSVLGYAEVTATFVPADDAQVVVQLRPSGLSASERELRMLRASLAQNPTNLPLAADLARRLIQQARRESDPRYLGQAEVALAPWWHQAAPPVEALILRATIRQSLHDFTAALADLDAALKLDGRNIQAWLTQFTVHTVRGEYDSARRDCLPLLRLGDNLTATTAAATLASLTGDADRSLALLEAALARNAQAPAATRLWALTQLAETCDRRGRVADAGRHFQAALALSPQDPYLLGAYADFLLDQRRPAEAAALLRDFGRMDGLLLRLAEAHAALPAESSALKSEVAELTARFANARDRGDRVHLREEARFHLRLLGQPAVALPLARENWGIQKEPADARLLLEAARQAKDRPAEDAVLAWAATNRLEDIHLQPRALASLP